VREMLDVGSFVRNFLFSADHLWFATGGFCVVEICVRCHCSTRGINCCGLVSICDSVLSKEEFSYIIGYVASY